MNQFRFIPLILASLFAGWIALTGFASANTSLEEQVLQIIREHPEVLIESVQAYQQGKQDELQQSQQAFLQQMKSDPESVIGSSPTTGAAAQNIVLVEFSDFQCPFCAQAEPTLQEFIARNQDRVTLRSRLNCSRSKLRSSVIARYKSSPSWFCWSNRAS